MRKLRPGEGSDLTLFNHTVGWLGSPVLNLSPQIPPSVSTCCPRLMGRRPQALGWGLTAL